MVELLDDKDLKERSDRSGKELDIEELKEKATRFEDMQMDSNVAEGGG